MTIYIVKAASIKAEEKIRKGMRTMVWLKMIDKLVKRDPIIHK